jgi:hypothetical protein
LLLPAILAWSFACFVNKICNGLHADATRDFYSQITVFTQIRQDLFAPGIFGDAVLKSLSGLQNKRLRQLCFLPNSHLAG